MKALHICVIVATCAALGLVAAPRHAEACGGFFCSQTPIDQSAERIIFAKRGDDIVAWVQVVYSGAAEDFAWVVPVSSVPELDVADGRIFQILDQATGPQIFPPQCFFGGPMADGDAASESAGGAPPSRSEDEVIVYSEEDVGPYHTAVVGSENADLLINWLNDNDYIITPAMHPMVEAYVEDGMLFMAMKLQADQDVDALKPIVMTYEGSNPVIPIRLTAVAADPDMGILVWILGDGRAVPANFDNVEIDLERLRFDGALRSNYRTVVSQQVDEIGGQGFVTEYAAETVDVPVFDEEVRAILDDYSWLTRLYTTISPEEMTVDPVFTFNPALPPVSNVIDLSTWTHLCEDMDSPCDFNHCGPDSTCYEVNGAAACECPEGFVARGVSDPVTGAAVTCTPQDRDMLGDAAGDPCTSTTCGEFGSCVAVNGTATCSCSPGYVASSGRDGAVACVDVDLAEQPPSTGDPVIPGEQPNDSPAGAESGCSVAGGTASPVAALVLLALVGLIAVRRRL